LLSFIGGVHGRSSVKRIRDSLRTAGHEVWFDKSDLRGGDAWDAASRGAKAIFGANGILL
jgi:hypothetical protein